MGGDDFNKRDESDGVLPFAPVAKKQTQMNAEHASWLQENHFIETNKELLESISKLITKAASKGKSHVVLLFTRSYPPTRLRPTILVLQKNGFYITERDIEIDLIRFDKTLDNIFGEPIPSFKGSKIRCLQLSIRW